MSDPFKRQEETINKVKKIGLMFDANGRYIPSSRLATSRFMTKDKVPLPCDDIPNWNGDESCKTCPEPCEDVTQRDESPEPEE
jgi:hypothetical protein